MNADRSIQTILSTVRQLSAEENYEDAFEMLLSTFILTPEVRPSIFAHFHKVLKRLNDTLLDQERIPELFNNIEAALKHYPDNALILNDLGTYLYKLGYLHEACAHFQRALLGNMTFVTAEKNLNSLKNLLVERWHFRMLNDRIRNESYRRAIQEKVIPNVSNVLDIGSGTGLLSILAHLQSPLKITALESSKTMYEISQQVLKDNNCCQVNVINKSSIECDSSHIGGQHNLLITEIFDAGLFGEGVLQTLSHGLSHLLNEGSTVIPMRADVYIAAIQSEVLGLKYHLGTTAKSILNAEDLNAQMYSDSPYDTEDVDLYKDVVYLTEDCLLVSIDFTDPQEILKLLTSKKPINKKFTVIKRGYVDLFVSWFDLHLTENIKLTTNPKRGDKSLAWQQALYHKFERVKVQIGESVDVDFACVDGKLTVSRNRIKEKYNISKRMLRFLNDSVYVNLLKNSVGSICIYLCQSTEVNAIDMFDLSPFPLIGFLMMQRGARHLTCCVSKNDEEFISKVLSNNNIPKNKVTFLDEEHVKSKTFNTKKFDLVVSNLIGMCGDIDITNKQVSRNLKIYNTKTGSLVIPHKINLVATVVDSNWIEMSNNLLDENVFNLKIDQTLNKFQVSQHFNLDLSTIQSKKLTARTSLFSCADVIQPGVIQIKSLEDGDANAILCSYEIQLIENGEILTTDRPNSFVDGMAFISNPRLRLSKNQTINIVCCADRDESFKLILNMSEDADE